MKPKQKKISAKEFLKKVFNQRRAIHLSQTAIQKLEEKWIKDYCPVAVGHSITIANNAEGYTSFLIGKIHVDIDMKEGETKEKDQFSIQFSFSGVYRGEGLEDKPGRTRFNVVEEKPVTNEE